MNTFMPITPLLRMKNAYPFNSSVREDNRPQRHGMLVEGLYKSGYGRFTILVDAWCFSAKTNELRKNCFELTEWLGFLSVFMC
jgi:hypothetical protein